MEIIQKMSAVMEAVGNVSKGERNQAQGFNFRGIDAVVNAVSPALRKQGVVVVPTLLSCEYSTVTVGQRQTQMAHARVTVQYTFWAGDGSSISAVVSAESMDSGDKATAKAMSVAFRTALLQSLCLPTDEMDPDHDIYERTSKPRVNRVPESERVTTKEIKPMPVRNTQETKQLKKVDVTPVKSMSRAQQAWVMKQIQARHPGEDPMVLVGDLIGRTISSLDEVTPPEVKVLVPALADKVEE